MLSGWVRLITILSIGFVSLTVSTGYTATENFKPPLKIHDKAPNLIGSDLRTGAFFLLSKQPQKPKIINFFWVECKPCIKELPHIADYEKKYPNIAFYAVHSGENSDTGLNYSKQEVNQFIQSLPIAPQTIVWVAPDVMRRKWARMYPSTVVLNAENKVVEIIEGYQSTIERLDKLLPTLK